MTIYFGIDQFKRRLSLIKFNQTISIFILSWWIDVFIVYKLKKCWIRSSCKVAFFASDESILSISHISYLWDDLFFAHNQKPTHRHRREREEHAIIRNTTTSKILYL